MGKASRQRAQGISPGAQRSSRSACGGPIEWMSPASAAAAGAWVDEAVEQLGEDLDIWHCTSAPCGEWGFIIRQWEA